MLQANITINGITIAHLYAINKGQVPNTEHTLYKFEYYRVGEGVVSRGNILHLNEEGSEVLISKILKIVQKGVVDDG